MLEKPTLEEFRVWKNLPTTQYLFKLIDADTQEMLTTTVDPLQPPERIAQKTIYMSGVVDGLNSLNQFLNAQIESADNIEKNQIVESQKALEKQPFLSRPFYRSGRK